MLVVQVLRPIHSSHHAGEGRKQFLAIADQEFLCIGSQPLVALKDLISCQIDINVPGDCSDNPDISHKPSAGEINSSSFFFINDCFYNDMRRITNIDYSE